MIDFLDDANKYACKNQTAHSDSPASLLLCQIWNNYLLPELSVCVSNYTEDICSCVKFGNNYLLAKLSLATNIYHISTHSVSIVQVLIVSHASIITYKILLPAVSRNI